jgi:hypothetical protein
MGGLDIYVHRGGAKCAENIYFMLAVDPPIKPADRKDGKHKGLSASDARNYFYMTNSR